MMDYQTLNQKYTEVMNRILFIRLINAGKSNMSGQQDTIVKETFDLAYEILLKFYRSDNRGKRADFRKLYRDVLTIVPGSEIKSVIAYPEKYEKMVEAKKEFMKQTAGMIVEMNALSPYLENKAKMKEA
jgi:hypothetical protein